MIAVVACHANNQSYLNCKLIAFFANYKLSIQYNSSSLGKLAHQIALYAGDTYKQNPPLRQGYFFPISFRFKIEIFFTAFSFSR